MSRRAWLVLVAVFALVAGGLPVAWADDLDVDADATTAGDQRTVAVSAVTGGSIDIPVDLFVRCNSNQRMPASVIFSLSGSSVPSGGAMTGTQATVVRPAGWPTGNCNTQGATTVTAKAKSTLRLTAPTTAGSYTYVARWATTPADANVNVNNADVTITLTAVNPTPVDTTPPVLSRQISGTTGQNGWYTSGVTVTWSVTDAQSTPVVDAGCGVQSFPTETAAATSSCQAHSLGGSASSSVPLKIDLTAPSSTITPSGTLGQNGWYTSAVTLTAGGQDSLSGPVTCTPQTQQQTAETTGASFSATCTNAAGLSSTVTSAPVRVDRTGPAAISSVVAGTVGSNGWYTSEVRVRTTGSDPVSGGVTCSADTVLGVSTGGTAVAGSCTNAAGLTTQAAPLPVRLDTSDPDASLSVDGPLGENGWYTGDVTVSASGSDDVSDPTACDPAVQHLTTDSTGTAFSTTCTNDAGRSTQVAPVTVRRDATPPTDVHLVVTGTALAPGWFVSDVSVTTVGTDATSGVTCTAPQLLDAETGGTVVTGSCTNGAGLTVAAEPVTVRIDRTAPTATTRVVNGSLGADDWYTSAVTLRTSGTDTVGGAVTCTADVVLTDETRGDDVAGSCTNAAGLSTTSAAVRVRIDRTGPSARLDPSGLLGEHGWFRSAVDVTTSGADAVSEVASCTGPQRQENDTTGTVFAGSCTNGAGLTTAAAPLTVKVDATAPVVRLSAPAAPSTGWYTAAVTVTPEGTDGTSGIASCSAPVTVQPDTAGTTVDGSCRDTAGNEGRAEPSTVKVDATNPTAHLVAAGDLGQGGWYTGDVAIDTEGSDTVSDPTACTPRQLVATDTAGVQVAGSCTNAAGLTQEATPLTIKRDASAPVDVHLEVVGTRSQTGWYTSAVTVRTLGADPTSGVTCTADQTLGADTDGIEVTGRCTNGAGLVTDAAPVTLQIDRTAPSVTSAVTSGTPGANGWYTSAVTVTTTGSDTVGGAVSCSAPVVVDTETTGRDVVTTCTNAAGLSASATQPVKLDTTAPATSVTAAGTAGLAGWFTSAVDVTTSGVDAVSGIASCTAPQRQDVETTGHLFAGTCTNGAGLTSAGQVTVKVDRTGPTEVVQTPTGRPGANGWFTGDEVVVTTTGADLVSGGVTCTAARTRTAETNGTTYQGACTNAAGLTTEAADLVVRLDRTAPAVTLTPSGTRGSNGWWTTTVDVTATATDDGSGVASCDPAAHVAGNSAGTLVTLGCTDVAGLRGTSSSTVKVDLTDPSATLGAAGTLGAGGWYTGDVTVSTTGGDDVSDPTTCTAPQQLASDTTSDGRTFEGSCTNDAGRTTAAAPLTVKRDASAPTARLEVVGGTAGANGWYTSAVTVRTTGADPQSGVTCSLDRVLSADAVTTVTGSCTNGAGLTTEATPLVVRLDTTGPTAALTASGPQGSNGWYTGDVDVTTSGADAVSGGVVCTPVQRQTTDTAGATFAGACTNAAGLTTAAPALVVKRDATAPTATLAATGTTGAGGWFVGVVTATTTGADPTSGPVSCTAPQQVTSDTTGQVLQGSCTNGAGLVGAAAPVTVRRDATAPVVTVDGLAASYLLGTVPRPTCTTTDATSGVAVTATPSVPATPVVGTYTATCSGAADVAGNPGAATARFQVVYRVDGFLQPINDTAHDQGAASIFKAGSTVPAKIQLKRADGTVVTPGAAPAWLKPVKLGPTTAPVDESVVATTATSGEAYRYDATAQQWIYNWSTKGLTAGYYYRIGILTDDGQVATVVIGLR